MLSLTRLVLLRLDDMEGYKQALKELSRGRSALLAGWCAARVWGVGWGGEWEDRLSPVFFPLITGEAPVPQDCVGLG